MKKGALLPILVSVIILLAWWIHPLPFEPSDLWAYSKRAHSFFSFEDGEVIKTSSINTHIFSQRLSVYVPIGIIYSIAGVSMKATSLWPLMAMIGIVWGLWYSCTSIEESFVSIFVAITSLPFFFQFTTLRPDIFVALSILILFILIDRRYRAKSVLLNTSLISGVLYFGLFAKLSIYWAGAVWLVVLAEDIYSGKWQRTKQLHASVILGGLIALGLYLATCQAIWGNPLARLEAIKSVSGSHLWSWSEKSLAEKIKRMTYGPLLTFTTAYGPLFPFTVGGLLMWRKGVRFWDKALLIILFLYWFGTTSFSLYEPLPAMPRMVLPAFPLMCITAGSFVWNDVLSSEAGKSRQLVPFAAVSALLFVSLLKHPGSEVHLLSSGLALSGIVIRFLPSLQTPEWIKIAKLESLNSLISAFALAAAVAVAPAARFLSTVSKPDVEKKAMILVKNRLSKQNQRVTLLTGDQRSPRHLKFYFNYSYPTSLNVEYAESINKVDDVCKSKDNKEDVLFMYNRGMSKFLNKAYGKDFVTTNQMRQANYRKLFGRGDISIFQLCGRNT